MTAKFGLLIGAKVTGENNIRKLGNSMQGVQGKAKNLAGAVKGVGAAFKALFAAAAIAGFGAFVKGAIDSADAFGKLSVRTGVAADKLQAYVNAGKLADVTQSDIENGLRKLAQTQSEAADGVATYSEAYGKLGVSVKSADGKLKPSDKLLGEIADKFKDLPNGPEKAAVAMDIFGRSGSKLITLLNGGSEALERFNYETSENFSQNAEYFNDQIEILKISFDGFRMQLADALLPALNAIMEVFGDLFSSGQDFGPLFKTIEIGVRGVSSVVLALVQSMRFFVRTISDLVKIANLVMQGNFGGALDVAKTGLADTREQFFKDMGAQGKVLFGTSEAGADYFNRGTGSFSPRAVAAGRGARGGIGGNAQTATANGLKAAQARLRAALDERAVLQSSTELERIRTEGAIELSKIAIEYAEAAEKAKSAAEIDVLVKAQAVEVANTQVEIASQLDSRHQSIAESFANTFVEAEGINAQLKEQESSAEKLKELYKSIKDTIATGMVNAIEGLLDGTKTLGQSLSNILKQLGSMFLQFGMKGLIGSIFPSAKGNVFAQNKIVPFAYGGVVNKPTLFPMANGMGLMGEAGPEAIMPLRRGPGGRLGVESSGGGVKVGTININVENTGESLTASAQKQIAGQVQGIVLNTLANERRSGGML